MTSASIVNTDDQVAIFFRLLEALCARHPSVRAGIDHEDEDMLHLHSLAADCPGDGHGSAFMQGLTALLDRTRLAMHVDPADWDGDDGMSRLGAWYARFGFQWIGRDEGRMRREPI